MNEEENKDLEKASKNGRNEGRNCQVRNKFHQLHPRYSPTEKETQK